MSRRFAASLPVFLLLTACAPEVPDLPPEEVLRRATLAAETTSAAAFTADAELAFSGGVFGDGTGALRASGMLRDGGNTVATTFDVSLQVADSAAGEQRNLKALFETILVQGERLYLRVNRLESPAIEGMFDPQLVGAFLHTWWMFDAPETGATFSVTPSVSLLQAQARVVRVTRDLGPTTLDTIPVYHYGVAIDPERFLTYLRELHRESEEPLDEARLREELLALQATGELWIRADDFTVLQMTWEIPALPLPDHSRLSVTCTLRFRDASEAEAIVIPADARPFSVEALQPAQTQVPEEMLPEGVTEEDVRSAMENDLDTAVFPPAP